MSDDVKGRTVDGGLGDVPTGVDEIVETLLDGGAAYFSDVEGNSMDDVSDEQVDDVLLAVLVRFANEEMDQHECFTFDSEHGPAYVTISRQPDPDGRHYDQWEMMRDESGSLRAFVRGPGEIGTEADDE